MTEEERIARELSPADRRFIASANSGAGWFSAPKDGWRRSARGVPLSKMGLFDRQRQQANGLYWFRWTDVLPDAGPPSSSEREDAETAYFLRVQREYAAETLPPAMPRKAE